MSKKRDFYEQIWINNVKTFFLFIIFFLLISAIGWTIGFYFNNVAFGIILTLIIAVIYSIFAFFAGGSMILKLTGAKEASKNDYAYYVNTVEGLAIAAGIPTPKAYVIDTPALNAFATGRSPEHAAVTVTTGLLQKLNREELEGVVAHEIAHIKNYDIRTMMIASILVGIVIILSDIMIRSVIFSGNAVVFIVVIAVAILSPFIAYIIKLMVSRKREYIADAEGARLTRNPMGLANALQKISGDTHPLEQASSANEHMFISTPKTKSFFAKLFSTHPPIQERIELLKNM